MKKFIIFLCLISFALPLHLSLAKGSWRGLPNKGKSLVSKRKGYESNIAVSTNGKIYVAYQENGKRVQVKMYQNGSWLALSDSNYPNGVLTTGESGNPNMVALDNDLYIAFMDESNNGRAKVMKWNGSSWITLSDSNYPDGYISSAKGNEPELAFDKDNQYLYVAFNDSANNSRTKVLRWSQTFGWENVGDDNGLVNNSIAQEVTLVSSKVDSSMYVAFEDHTNGSRIRVMKWNGSDWSNLADSSFPDGLISQYDGYSPSIDVDSSDNLYLIYTSRNNFHGSTIVGSLKRKEAKTYIYKWNGTSWSAVGNGIVSNAKQIESCVSVDDRGYVYVAFSEHKKNFRIERKRKTFWRVRVKVWNGSKWDSAKKGGSEYLSKGKLKSDPSLATLNNKLYISFTDDFYKSRVRAFELTY